MPPITFSFNEVQHAVLIASLATTSFEWVDPQVPLEVLEIVAPHTANDVRALIAERKVLV